MALYIKFVTDPNGLSDCKPVIGNQQLETNNKKLEINYISMQPFNDAAVIGVEDLIIWKYNT